VTCRRLIDQRPDLLLSSGHLSALVTIECPSTARGRPGRALVSASGESCSALLLLPVPMVGPPVDLGLGDGCAVSVLAGPKSPEKRAGAAPNMKFPKAPAGSALHPYDAVLLMCRQLRLGAGVWGSTPLASFLVLASAALALRFVALVLGTITSGNGIVRASRRESTMSRMRKSFEVVLMVAAAVAEGSAAGLLLPV